MRFDISPNPDKAVKRHQPDIENVRIPLGSHLKVKRLEKKEKERKENKKRKIQIDSLSMFEKNKKNRKNNFRRSDAKKMSKFECPMKMKEMEEFQNCTNLS